MNATLLLVLSLLAAPQAQAVPATGAEPQLLAADTPMTTSAGTTFTAPAGWTLDRKGNVLVLTPPEGDSRLALVEVEAPDADAAAKAAWTAYRPDAKWPVQLSTARRRRTAGKRRGASTTRPLPTRR